jgi:macrolide transport system ATP-binding/permease protein
MKGFFQDLVFALRQLRKTPGFTLTVILTLALGIGANAAIFTLIHSILLSNLPVANPDMLVRLGDRADCCVMSGVARQGEYSLFSTSTYSLFRKSLPEFEELAAMQSGNESLIVRRQDSQDVARPSKSEFVSGNYFRTFGLSPRAGRFFSDADDTMGAPFTAVMSYETWQRQYAGDPSVLGSTFQINTWPVTIIGIAPRGYFGDRIAQTPPEFYLPMTSMKVIINAPYYDEPEAEWAYIVGRVRPGVSRPALQDKVNALLRQQFATFEEFSLAKNKPFLSRAHAVLTPAGAGIRLFQEAAKTPLTMLAWIAAMVLLLACANVANLMLVRSAGRRQEICVRTALGARRFRVVRQLLTESVLLAVFGGLASLVVAYAGAGLLLAMAFSQEQRVPIDAAPALPVIGFAFVLSLVTGILFGLAPAWTAAQTQPADALRTSTRTASGSTSLIQRSLVILQAALSLVLLVAAGLFAQSLNKLEGFDMHLDARNRYIVHINPQAAGYKPSQVEQLYRTMEARFHTLPGVVNVGISIYTPMEGNNWENTVHVQGKNDPDRQASFVKANAEYFDSVGTRLMMGRGFTPRDTLTAPPVAVVNQEFVKQFFKPGENPIGHRMGSESPGDYEIVGVVENTTYTTVRWENHAMYFVPITQRPAGTKEPVDEDRSLYAGTLVLQTTRPVENMEKLAARTLASINPNLSVVEFQTFGQQIADQFMPERIVARLTGVFGALALLLATLGLYGVTSYGVVRRTAEIGIRMALGARRARVISMVMRGAMVQVLLGLLIGAPVAWFCVRYIKSQLYEITSVNLALMAASIGVLAAAACIAGLIPARRASSIDPVKALRVE